jgi:hypothetical protein
LAAFALAGAHASYSGTTTAGVLTVSNGIQTTRVKLTGDYTAATWTLASDGHGGAIVKDSTALLTQAAAAFAVPTAPLLTPPTLGPPRQDTLIHG